jgi:YD repeat-containing protein
MNKSEILSIYAAVVSTIVAAVQITNLARAIEKEIPKVRITASIKEIDVPGLTPQEETKEDDVEYEYSYIEDGQLIGRTFKAKNTGNVMFEGFAYKERQALVVEIFNNEAFQLSLGYVGFRLPDRTNLPIPFDSDVIQKTKVYPRHRWLTYQRRSNASPTVVKAKGKAIFWIEIKSFYQFLVAQGFQGKIRVKPFIEDEEGKPIDGRAITLSIQA